MLKCNKTYFKTVVFMIFMGSIKVTSAQPIYPPFVFEDNYKGKADDLIKSAKVKTKKTYYKLSDNSQAILYHTFEYNPKGYLISQKWYNLKSKKEMYSAYYTYDDNNLFTSCIEAITNEFDSYDYHSRQLDNNGSLLGNEAGDALGAPIPTDKNGNSVVKTLYLKDSSFGFIATKYFYNDSLYKEKECPFWMYGPELYENLYINTDKSVEYVCSDLYYKCDTIYKSTDTLSLSIKVKKNGLECFKILKIRLNNSFVITDIDRVLSKIRLHFSYKNSFLDKNYLSRKEINSITYIDYKAVEVSFLLVHKFEDLDKAQTQLNNRIELTEINNQDFFTRAQSCLYYTKFKDGNLFSEEQYSIGTDKIRKLREIKYTHHNLVSEKVCYNACFGLMPLSKALDYDQRDSIEEINIYEYFK